MVKARTLFSLLIMAVVTVAATASCGSDEGTGGGAAGGGVLSDGGNSGRGGSVGRAGAAGAGTAGTATGIIPPAVSKLATKCATDKDCGTDLKCITAGSTDFNGGGPAGGYCTLPCTGPTDASCDALEPGAACFNLGTTAAPNYSCLLSCVQGGNFDNASNKCQSRSDLTCYDVSSTATPRPFCIPMCQTDQECGTGSYCDLGAGTCTKTKPVGDPVGSDCTPATRDADGNVVSGSNNCAALCIRTSADNVTPATGKCVEFCSGLLPCGYKGEQPNGMCYGALSDEFGLLDIGYCLPSCDCSGTCPFSDDVCRAWTSDQQDFVTQLGKKGLCVPDLAGSTELTSCTGEGGAGGAGDAGAGGAAGQPGGDAGEGGSSGSR